MANRWSLKKVLLCSLIGALALSALAGIYILVVGDFGETEERILWTTLSLTGFSVTALGCTVVLHRRRALWLAAPGLVASGFGFAWSLPMIWAEWHSEPVLKTMVVLIIFAFSFAQSCLLALAPLKQRLAWVFVAALVCIFALAVLLSTSLIFELEDELLARMAGVLGILDACATLAVPILYRLGGKGPVDARPAADGPQDHPWQIELCCPRCGHRDVHTVGEIHCPSCSLGIRVTICDEGDRGQGRRFQFSLRALLVAILLVSLPLAWVGFRISQLRGQAAVLQHLTDLNPEFGYHRGNLHWLSFANADPSQFDASMLARLKELPRLESLNLKGMPLSDDDLIQLKGMSLKSLDLSNTRITDAGLVHLKALPELRYVDVSNTAVTAEGAQKARARIPDLVQ